MSDEEDRSDESRDVVARLHANPRYQAALRDAESGSWEGPGVSAGEMIEAANERRRVAGRGQV